MTNWHWEISNDGALFPPTVTSFVDGWRPWFGVMKDGPSVVAEVFSREFIQNFADAGDELKNELGLDEVPSVEFRFLRLAGLDADRVRSTLGLTSHVDRYNGFSGAEQNDHRLGESELLTGSTDDLTLLVAQERYSTGMYGPWSTDGYAELEDGRPIRRKMRDALVKPSGTKSSSKALGSYGEGKKGVILSSRLRTVLAYSCFEPRADEPEGDTTRRLLGVSYWRKHIRDRREYTGLALYGAADSPRPRPFDDADADALVESLDIEGLIVRDPSIPRDLGTTWVFVEPAFDAAQLSDAIERNWWPRLETGTLGVKIIDEDDVESPVDPRSKRPLRPFLEAHDLLIGKRAPTGVEDEIVEVHVSGLGPIGRVGLTADVADDGWSWDDPDRNAQMAAIVRSGMVIQYVTSPPQRPDRIGPYVRGVFLAEGDDAEPLLRNAEPPLHNYWEVDPTTGYPKDSVNLARVAYQRINEAVRTFAKRFKEEKKGQEFQFDTFASFFRVSDKPIVDKPKKKVTVETMDPWHMVRTAADQLVADPSNPDNVGVVAGRSLSLKSEWPDDSLEVVVRLGWRVLEDDDAGVAAPELADPANDSVPEGFVLTDDGYQGTITKDPVEFSWSSQFYESDWLTKASFEVQSTGGEESDG